MPLSASSSRSTNRPASLVTGADSLEVIAVYIGMLGLDFRVTEPAGLVDHLRVVGERYRQAITE